jgi:hypothetical protein
MHKRYEETQCCIFDLLGHSMVDLMAGMKALDGCLRRADGAKVKITQERGPASNREGDEYLESAGKLKEDIGEREGVCSSPTMLRHRGGPRDRDEGEWKRKESRGSVWAGSEGRVREVGWGRGSYRQGRSGRARR